METPQGNTIWKLSIATIVISGIEFLFAVSLAIALSTGTTMILQSDNMRKLATGISDALASASIEVGSVDINVQTQDGATVSFSNIPNIDAKKLQEAGVINDSGKFVGNMETRIAVALVSVSITAATIAALLAFFTIVAGAITLSNAGKPQKFGAVFGWSLVGAIICFLVGRLVLAVLFAIMAISARKGSNAYRKEAPAMQKIEAPAD